VRIATGARVPGNATAVVRSEHAVLDAAGRTVQATRSVVPGQDIRPRGQECRSGDRLLPPGARVTPAVLGVAAAAGYDEVRVVVRPTVEVLVLGDELLGAGLPRDGLIRDALGPMLAPWLAVLGAEVVATRRLGDDAEALYEAVKGSTADLVITTGGTAAGPVDHVHGILRRVGAELLVDSVAVRPGHPMLLARLAPGRFLVGLPGNPLAAVAGLVTLAEPVLRTLCGMPYDVRGTYVVPVRGAVRGHPVDTRLVPVVHDPAQDTVVAIGYNGPAMLRGLAVADGLAVVPPGGAEAGQELEILDLPWGTPGQSAPHDTADATGAAGTAEQQK
jgi:molybdopterin molybdotransferase